MLSKEETYGSAGTNTLSYHRVKGQDFENLVLDECKEVPRGNWETMKGCANLGDRNNKFLKELEVNPALKTLLEAEAKLSQQPTGLYGTTVKLTTDVQWNESQWDKNTPGSLKNLRWSIYELIERYEGDYGKTISHLLKQRVEELFKEYTNS